MREGFFDAGTLADADGVIGNYLCDGHLDIVKLWIPNTVTRIGTWAFRNCTNLAEIQFEDGATLRCRWDLWLLWGALH